MKKITCLFILIFCISLQMMAQVKKTTAKPATPPMPDMEKMLKDLPADQQAMAKEMLKNGTSGSSNKEEVVTKTPSPIIKIHLKQPLQVPTQAQAKDHLLWYKGKKINDSMLVTTKAMVVLYSKRRSMVIAQPLEETDSFRIMVKNVSKQAKMTEDYINKAAAKKNSFIDYPLIQMTVDKFQEIDELFNNAIKNTIDLPEIPTSKVPAKSKGSDINEDYTPEQSLKEMHNRLKQLLQNEPDMHVDPPPKENFSISYQCDENAKGKYLDEVKKWAEDFHEYEYSLMRLSLGIERYIQLTFGNDAVAESISPGITEDMKKAFDRFFSRLDEKIKQLISRYGKNIFMQKCIITTAVGLERQKQLMGLETETDLAKDAIELMKGPEFENYINEQINKKNWDVILNYSMILGRNRTAQLMGFENGLIDRLSGLYDRITKLNRFALTVDIDFNVQFPDDRNCRRCRWRRLRT